MSWYRYRQVPDRQYRFELADSRGAHLSKEPDMAQMDPSAADMALAVPTSYVQDAGTHPCQWPCTIRISQIAIRRVWRLVPSAGLSGGLRLCCL